MHEDVETSHCSSYSAFPDAKATALPSYEDWAEQHGPLANTCESCARWRADRR
jgi:hypothetical protein